MPTDRPQASPHRNTQSQDALRKGSRARLKTPPSIVGNSIRMKSRIIWAIIMLAAITGFYYTTIRPANNTSPGFSRRRPPLKDLAPPEIPPPPIPSPNFAPPTLLPPPITSAPIKIPALKTNREPTAGGRLELPIQDNSAIDFSTGAPVVRSGSKEQAALDLAAKEMREATQNTSFPGRQK